MRRASIPSLIAASAIAVAGWSIPAVAEKRLAELPLPVQAWVLRLAVEEFGVKDPWGSITAGDDIDFSIPGVPGSDFNRDGRTDYTANLCFLTGGAWTSMNGFPCMAGMLFLSRSDGSYRFVAITGIIRNARFPYLVVTEQRYGECNDFRVCDVLYRFTGWEHQLEQIEVCNVGKCTLDREELPTAGPATRAPVKSYLPLPEDVPYSRSRKR